MTEMMQTEVKLLFVLHCLVWIMCVLIAGCLGNNLCGKEMVESNGRCIILMDTETYIAGNETDSDPVEDAGDTDNGADSAGSGLPKGMNDHCTSHKDCSSVADYCLQPSFPDLNGFCTLQGCVVDPNDCPSGYSCMDLSVYLGSLPTVCTPEGGNK